MFHVRFQSEEMAYHTKIGKGLQTYSLCYESHSTKPGDTKKKSRMGDVTVRMYKLQRAKNNTGTKMT